MRPGIALLLFFCSAGVFSLEVDQVNSLICFGLDLTQRPTEVEYSSGEVAELDYDNNTITIRTYYKRGDKDYRLSKITYANPYLIESDDYILGKVDTATIIILDEDRHLKQIKAFSTLYYSSGVFRYTGSGYSVEFSTDSREKHFGKSSFIEISQPDVIRLVAEGARSDLLVTQANGRTFVTKTVSSDRTTTATYHYSDKQGT